MKKIAVGEQILSIILDTNKIYVDKTKEILKVMENQFVFLGRPRRFGKSLAIDTMKEMFLGNKELFKGLYAYDHYKDWDTSYPVVLISMIGYEKSFSNNIDKYLKGVTTVYINNKKISLDDYYKDSFCDLSQLITKIYKETGKQVVVLIDEYDTPFTKSLHSDEEFQKIKNFFSKFYGFIKNSGEYIKFFYFSGLTKVAQTSLFSTLNNLNNISFAEPYYDILGYTKKEIKEYYRDYIEDVKNKLNITEEALFEKLEKFYGGYCFGSDIEKIYNPWSVNNFFEKKIFKNYWGETGGSSISDFILKKNKLHFLKFFSILETEEKFDFTGGIRTLEDLTPGTIPLLLLNAGYLSYTNTKDEEIMFPNIETRQSIVSQYVFAFQDKTGVFENFYNISSRITKAIIAGNAKNVVNGLMELKDVKGSPYEWMDKNPEGFMKDALFFILRLMGLVPQGELQNTNGRTDITFEENGLLYIIEYKIDGSLEDGMKQINDRYLNQFTNNKGYKIVINFKKKTTKAFEALIEKFGH